MTGSRTDRYVSDDEIGCCVDYGNDRRWIVSTYETNLAAQAPPRHSSLDRRSTRQNVRGFIVKAPASLPLR